MKKLLTTHYKLQTRKAFTFIEMIVVIGVVALTLPVLFTIIFAIFQQQVKVYRLAVVKREGDYAMNFMKSRIREAVKIKKRPIDIDSCKTAGSSDQDNASSNLDFIKEDETWYGFHFLNQGLAAWDQAANTDHILTSNKVKVNPPVYPLVRCFRSSTYSAPIAVINFKIEYNTSSDRPEEIVSLRYQASVKLKNN